MTGPAVPAPARPEAPDDAELQLRPARAVSTVDAPDVVFAVSRGGRRTTACGGTGGRDGSGSTAHPAPREALRYGA